MIYSSKRNFYMSHYFLLLLLMRVAGVQRSPDDGDAATPVVAKHDEEKVSFNGGTTRDDWLTKEKNLVAASPLNEEKKGKAGSDGRARLGRNVGSEDHNSPGEHVEFGSLNHIPGFTSSEEKMLEYDRDLSSTSSLLPELDLDEINTSTEPSSTVTLPSSKPSFDIVTKLLRIVESQAMQGANCTPGTDLSLGDKVRK